MNNREWEIKRETIEGTFDFLLLLSILHLFFQHSLSTFGSCRSFSVLNSFVGILLLGTNAKSRQICSLIKSYIFVNISNKVFKTMFEVKVYNSFSTALIRAIELKINWYCLRSQFRLQLNNNNNNNIVWNITKTWRTKIEREKK